MVEEVLKHIEQRNRFVLTSHARPDGDAIGSALACRQILLAMGKFKPFTASVLIAGATNVIASYCFVKFFHWGLRGIVLGTIVAVVGRCALWMPWYVMRVLRDRP